MKRSVCVPVLAAVAMFAATAFAHHSFTATYDEDALVEIEGRIVQFMFRNPHSWVHVMAPDEDGEVHRWGVEWGGAGQLGRQGVSRSSLRPGDVVVITGNPGRNPADHRIRMRTLLRTEDGYGWGQQGEDFD